MLSDAQRAELEPLVEACRPKEGASPKASRRRTTRARLADEIGRWRLQGPALRGDPDREDRVLVLALRSQCPSENISERKSSFSVGENCRPTEGDFLCRNVCQPKNSIISMARFRTDTQLPRHREGAPEARLAGLRPHYQPLAVRCPLSAPVQRTQTLSGRSLRPHGVVAPSRSFCTVPFMVTIAPSQSEPST